MAEEEEQLSGSFSGSRAGIMWQEKDIFKQVCVLHVWIIWCLNLVFLKLLAVVLCSFLFSYWIVSVFKYIFLYATWSWVWTQDYTSLPRLGTTWGRFISYFFNKSIVILKHNQCTINKIVRFSNSSPLSLGVRTCKNKFPWGAEA